MVFATLVMLMANDLDIFQDTMGESTSFNTSP